MHKPLTVFLIRHGLSLTARLIYGPSYLVQHHTAHHFGLRPLGPAFVLHPLVDADVASASSDAGELSISCIAKAWRKRLERMPSYRALSAMLTLFGLTERDQVARQIAANCYRDYGIISFDASNFCPQRAEANEV